MNRPKTGRPICLLLRDLPNGGVEQVTLNLAVGLVAQGHEIDLVLFERSGALVDSVPDQVGLFDLGGPASFGRAPLTAPWRLARAFGRYCAQRRPLAVIASKEQANLLAVGARLFAGSRAPTILLRHVPLDPKVVGLRESRPLARALYRTVYRRADAIVAVSRGIAEEIRGRTGARFADRRLHVIANPVLGDRIDRLAAEECRIPAVTEAAAGEPVILGVGRLERQKGFDALIEAFALVADQTAARLVILGEGPMRGALEARIAERGLAGRAFLVGHVDNPYAAMRRADLFVLASRWEGMPTVLIEAMHLGVPVVATDCPTGPAELLEGGRLGELTSVDDHRALAFAVLRQLRGGRRPPKGPDVLEQYSTAHAARVYGELIDSLVAIPG